MRRTLLLTSLIALSTLSLPALADSLPDEWLTPSERAGFRSTPSFSETMAFLRRIESRLPGIVRVTEFGRSAEGRALPLVIVSSVGAFTPEAARATGLPVLLIQSGIHAGEIDGKDATLMLLRDLALGLRPELAEGAITLFVPIFNVDGHERVSPFNRPNQDGPEEGMGFRATTNGLNLNRDFLRLASPEARAMISLFNTWRPHLHVDNHVTNGSDSLWVLTWLVAEAPQLDPGVDAWVRQHLPRALAATEAAGHPSGPYVDLLDWSDPTQGIIWDVAQPRYSSGYFPLRHRPSILVEMHSHKPYGQRVLANRDFMAAVIAETVAGGHELVRAVATAERRTVAAGRPEAPPSEVVIGWGVAEDADVVSWPAYAWEEVESVVTGGKFLRYRRGELATVEIPWRHRPVAELTAPRPRGYLVSAGWPQVEEALTGHGLRLERLAEDVELEVETIRVADPSFAGAPFQGSIAVREFAISRQVERRKVPRESLWIPADQPDFEVAVQLLEPEAPDSLLRWGALLSVFERKEYIGLDVLDRLAREMLADPGVRAAWERALANQDFAGDRRRRFEWWYQRTPYWDEQVGLLPVFRVMHPVELPTR